MITSIQNPRIQWIRALYGKKSERQASQAFVIEGVRLVEEAILFGRVPRLVVFSRQVSSRGAQSIERCIQSGCEVEEIPPELMDRIAGTENPQGIIAVMPDLSPEIPASVDFAIIADGIRDPGNLGTLLRTSAAAGAQILFLTTGSADPFSPKVLRSGMGAHFRLPILTASWDYIYAQCMNNSPELQFFLAEAASGTPYWKADLKGPLALIIGGEAEGASALTQSQVTQKLTIPMPGHFESLNAAVAAGIIIFEIVRQRTP